MKQKYEAAAKGVLRSKKFWSVVAFVCVALVTLCVILIDEPSVFSLYDVLFGEGALLSFLLPLQAPLVVGVEMLAGLFAVKAANLFTSFSYILLGAIFVDSLLLLLFELGYKNRSNRYFAKKKLERTARREGQYKFTYYMWYVIFAVVVLVALVVAAYFLNPSLMNWLLPEHVMSFGIGLVLTLLVAVLATVLIPLVVIGVVYLVVLLIHFFVSLPAIIRNAKARRAENRSKNLLKKMQNEAKMAEEGKLTKEMKKKGLVPVTQLFPALAKIDFAETSSPRKRTKSTPTTLEDFCLDLQGYLCYTKELYYDIDMIRSFVAGMAASRLIILQGLSGTGKSMMPRSVSNFVSTEAKFTPVQSTWRDRSDLIGYYNDFTKDFKETDFLKGLYKASYSDKINMMVLDEMNLSRIEYYFADFLSIMEFPSDQWQIKVYEAKSGQPLPKKLKDGYITVPTNTWFIGTANTDDSTFTITDKVYDRAFVIDFRERSDAFEAERNPKEINMSAEYLQEMFDEAVSIPEFNLDESDMEKFVSICDFALQAFEINFGNRIMKQIETFVPVFVAAGGTKEQALDQMFAVKILRKLEGAYEDYVKEGLVQLLKRVRATYGPGVFVETEAAITRLNKKMI